MQIAATEIIRQCPEHEIYESLLALDHKQIVELGCGLAEHTRRLAAAGPGRDVVAFEVDQHAHAANLAAAPIDNLRFAYGGAEKIDREDASCDVVMMFKSLHHVPLDALDQALAEVARVLRPGGFAYVSEPIFAGAFNDVIRVFHDEQRVREAAFAALQRAVASGLLALVRQEFFLSPSRFRDFAEFETRLIKATHSEHRLTPAQYAEVKRRFNTHLGDDGASFAAPMRVDLLQKPA